MALSTYSIFEKENSPTQVVATGFSFWPLVFNIFWLAYHRIWLVLIVVIALFSALSLLSTQFGFISLTQVDLLRTFLFIFIALEAGNFKEYALEKRGYTLVDITTGVSKEDAFRRFLDKQPKHEEKNLSTIFL